MMRSTAAIVILGLALVVSILLFALALAPLLAIVNNVAGGLSSLFLPLLVLIVILAIGLAVAVRVRLSY